jgi:hypothetical protein
MNFEIVSEITEIQAIAVLMFAYEAVVRFVIFRGCGKCMEEVVEYAWPNYIGMRPMG